MSIFKSFGKNNEYSEQSDWKHHENPIKLDRKDDIVCPKETIVVEKKSKENSEEKDSKDKKVVIIPEEEFIPMTSSPKDKTVHIIRESASRIYEDESEEKKSKIFRYEPTFKSNAIVFVIENTKKVNVHKKEILGLVKKIARDNQTSFFTFLKIGDDKAFHNLLTYDDVQEKNVIDTLLSDSEEITHPNYLEALNHIKSFFDMLRDEFGIYKFKEKKYDIQDVRMVFIGTANFASDEEENKKTLELMSTIKKFGRLKTLKYFCMEDKEAVNAAMMGFPIIGHINLNFYN